MAVSPEQEKRVFKFCRKWLWKFYSSHRTHYPHDNKEEARLAYKSLKELLTIAEEANDIYFMSSN